MVDQDQLEAQENTPVESFTGLTLCNIKDEWDWVKKGLQEVIDDDPDSEQIPEDIYAECKCGRAKLFVMDNKELFVVLTEHRESSKKIHLVVWYCWASKKGEKKMNVWLPDVERYAKENGYTSVVCESPHIGIAKYAIEHYGYFINSIVLKKYV